MPTLSDLPVPSASSQLAASLDFLGRAPLIPGDNTAGYDTLLARISGAVRPGDLIEEVWVRDVADLVWEAGRLRRLKAALMTACANEGMQKLLAGLNVRGNTFDLARRWAARELDAVGQTDAVLAAAGLSMDHVMAQTLRVRIGEIERIERLIASAEARRSAALRDIEHHRERFAASLRRAAQKAENIEDAEFEVVTPQSAQAAVEGLRQDSAEVGA
jgi:hypothetical protein